MTLLPALASAVREDLLETEGVKKLPLSRRAEPVFSSGSPATHIYFLDSGLVRIAKPASSGKEIMLGIIGAGDIFGEQALLNEGAFAVSAKVMEPGLAYAIPSGAFQNFCEKRPEAWRLLMQHFLLRKDELERKVEHLCTSDVRQRILYHLTELARMYPGSDSRGQLIHMSQNELASLVGATRETTSTTLNSLARQGLLSLGHRLILIPSVEALRNAGGSAQTQPAAAAGSPQQ